MKKEEILKQLNSKAKKGVAAATLVAMLATGGASLTEAKASVLPEQVDFVSDASEELARTQADWKKLLEEYSQIDCNFDEILIVSDNYYDEITSVKHGIVFNYMTEN